MYARTTPDSQRIVITGMGLATPLGCQLEVVWQRLLAGMSGLRRLPEQMTQQLAAKVAGLVPSIDEDAQAGLDADSVASPKDQRKMDRFILLALAAAKEALTQANWFPATDADQRATATVIASGVGGFPAIAEAVETAEHKGLRKLSPFTIPSFLVNLAAGHISINFGLKGPIGAPVTACAAGVQAIGDAARMIRAGEAQIALCGGAEACVHPVALGGFAAARALSTAFNDDPSAASRPFDRDRDGFVMGEGAGVVVIETLAHARERGVTPIAEIVGYGTSADAYHLTAGPEDGDGALRAMSAALDQANLEPSAVGHLNAHATSTPVGDKGELAAIKRLFAPGAIAVSSTKSATGHLLGAAGGMETIFTALSLRDQIIPPTLNLDNPDPAAEGVDLVAKQARPATFEYALSNGFGFGGVNASILLKRWQA